MNASVTFRGVAPLTSFEVGSRVVFLRAGEEIRVRGSAAQIAALKHRLLQLGGVEVTREWNRYTMTRST